MRGHGHGTHNRPFHLVQIKWKTANTAAVTFHASCQLKWTQNCSEFLDGFNALWIFPSVPNGIRTPVKWGLCPGDVEYPKSFHMQSWVVAVWENCLHKANHQHGQPPDIWGRHPGMSNLHLEPWPGLVISEIYGHHICACLAQEAPNPETEIKTRSRSISFSVCNPIVHLVHTENNNIFHIFNWF